MGPWFVVAVWLSWVTSLRGQSAPAKSVFFQCNDTYVSVSVKVDPLDTNRKLNPASLTLGKCPVSSTTALFGYFVFEYPYKACGFNRMAIGDYTEFFVNLVYMPTQIAPNQYSQPFVEPILCLVKRSMTPSVLTTTVIVPVSGNSSLNFGVRLMNDDFSGGRLDSKEFSLGSPINLELSVNLGNHMPLKLLVDEGVVTPTKDITTTQKYYLINNHGCFIDGKVAHSMFVEQNQLNIIWLTFPAMKFVNTGDTIYITFKLVVWDPKEVTELRKACSFFRDTNRWELLGDSSNTVCTCCDYTCTRSSRKKRGVNETEDAGGLIHTMVLGPFKIHSPSADGYGSVGNESRAAESGFLMPPAVGALFLELAVLLLLCIGVLLYSRSRQKLKETEERCLVTEH
ncbi:zona pellucida sperm-binding protein 3-like [Pyxicephalus adspersus]|uniref:zona pellucida sperm-binding protein 3-like n=1 Tax=Pyxicephalus adspersus TaxID=30357 RepID=UPI003B58C727